MKWYDTLIPYKVIDYKGIQYGVCRDFDHISRYRALRRVTHSPEDDAYRFVTLETPNAFTTHVNAKYYTVPSFLENRLDVIAYEHLGNPNYAWIIAYINNIEDGYTVREGQKLLIPDSITPFFDRGELLAPVSPLTLNLGTE